MTEETPQNKIDLVKEMVLDECLNEKYIIKNKKNRYRQHSRELRLY